MQVLAAETSRTIVGLGLTGFSCARYLASHKLDFRVADSRKEPPYKARFEEQFPGIELACGEFGDDQFVGDDVLIVSPGLALDTPAIARAVASGSRISSDVGIFMQVVEKPVIAITGSNGKSTVTTLVRDMLVNAGINAVAAGNIGDPVLDQLAGNGDVYVLELSSFQLECLEKVPAKAVTILNISKDHMDRYTDFTAYVAAKQRIFNGAEKVVYNRHDSLTMAGDKAEGQMLSYGLDAPAGESFGVLEEQGEQWLAFAERKLLRVADMRMAGKHNRLNAMAAMALCHCLAVDFAPMVETLKTFAGLKHRCQWLACYQGVNFYNDSKATNEGAAIAAIESLAESTANIVLIAGGQAKGCDFSQLAETAERYVRHAVLIGEDAELMQSALVGVSSEKAGDLEQAVAMAFEKAEPAGVVLLAPACASFDMFEGYQQRGDCYIQAVEKLAGGGV